MAVQRIVATAHRATSSAQQRQRPLPKNIQDSPKASGGQ